MSPASVAGFESDVARAWPAARPVSAQEVAQRFPKRGFLRAWEIPGAVLGLPESIVVALDGSFPWSLPRVALLNQPRLCVLPHVEQDGVFCLTPSTAAAALPVEIGHARQLVDEAVDVYQKGASGANQEDFLKEFGTYWELGQNVLERAELWLSDLSRTQAVSVASDGANIYVSESREKLESWLETRHVSVKHKQPGLYVKLSTPLYPEDYPATSADMGMSRNLLNG